MAEEKNVAEETVKLDKKAERARRKAEKKAAKQAKKEQKNGLGELEDDEEAEEKLGGRLVLVLVTLLIIVIWLAIIGVLIKSDVGGFGSSVLYPVLKDVPYVNRILPSQDDGTGGSTQSGTQYGYDSIDDAVARIKELEQELDSAKTQNEKDAETIAELQTEIEDLATYKEQEAAFESEKEKFYEEVVFSDEAPDINEYKTYYESIEPKNAEILYKQVVEQITYDESVDDYVKTYTQMQAKEAAAIFDTMTDNLSLVADILNNMGTKQRADILGKMDTETAAKLTKIMEPTKS
jgi:flagellar motility protein MotE (MotC chaperone)